jgi:hypothetical protein
MENREETTGPELVTLWKALSIRQPWCWAILVAGKRIENRTWPTNYRGPLLIHASGGMTRQEYEDFCTFYIHRFPRRRLQTYPMVPNFGDLERGGIVGQCDLIKVLPPYDDGDDGIGSPWRDPRQYGFVLDNVKSLPFQPARGQQGFFNIALPAEAA